MLTCVCVCVKSSELCSRRAQFSGACLDATKYDPCCSKSNDWSQCCLPLEHNVTSDVFSNKAAEELLQNGCQVRRV